MDRSNATVEELRAETASWLGARRADPRFARFADHLGILERVFGEMLAALGGELDLAREIRGSRETYERCARLDRGVLVVRRLFDWYAAKYDQRRDPRFGTVLAAADEVVRSCWREPFARVGAVPPSGPLVYLEPRFDAYATPRVSVPVDLRAPADAVVAAFVHELPIPVVCLPGWATREAWWLTLAAHETGHHVQHDLGDLRYATQEALAAVGPEWVSWSGELFADAYSVLMVGPSALWAVAELQHGQEDRSPRPGDAYPPPSVRLALMSEIARQSGLGDPGHPTELPQGPGIPQMPEISRAASAVLALKVQDHSLPEISGLRQEWFQPGGLAAIWAERLTEHDPLLTRLDERSAARVLVSAGVIAAETHPAAKARDRVHENLSATLPRCGPPGTMAGDTPSSQVDAIARRLAAQLVAP